MKTLNLELPLKNKNKINIEKTIDFWVSELKKGETIDVKSSYLFPKKYSKTFNGLSDQNKKMFLALQSMAIKKTGKDDIFLLLSSAIFFKLSNDPKALNSANSNNIYNQFLNDENIAFLNSKISESDINQHQANFNKKIIDLGLIDFSQFPPEIILSISLMPSNKRESFLLAFDSPKKNIYKIFESRDGAIEFIKYDLLKLITLNAPSPIVAPLIPV